MSSAPSLSVSERLAMARQHFHASRLPEAEALCRQLMDESPDLAENWHLLAQIAFSVGKPDTALELVEKAVALKVDEVDFLNTQGAILEQLGRVSAADKSLRRALKHRPDFPEALNNLGNVCNSRDRVDEAVECYRQALALRPDYIDAWFNLGLVLQRQEKWDESVQALRRVLVSQPQHIRAMYHLAGAMVRLGQHAQAMEQYRRVIGLAPELAEAHFQLAHLQGQLGHRDAAMRGFREALKIRPDFAEAHNSLGCLLDGMYHLEEARSCYLKALEIRPDFADALNNLGNIYNLQGELDMAEAQYLRALALRPDYPEALNGLAHSLKEQGRPAEAVAYYRKALALRPDYQEAYSNLLLCLHYDPDATAADIESAHRDWGRRVTGQIPLMAQQWNNSRDAERPLRVGFVSADFFLHAVAFFLKDVLKNLRPEQVEVFLYANNIRQDSMTQRLQSLGAWRDISSLDDEQAARGIREDEIDILVDLSGHTGRSRLLLFARKPAPIQVSWLGYPDTTGLPTMDYRLTDAITDPPGLADWHSEELVRLPEGFLCFGEPVASPPVVAPPILQSGRITFGSFNNNAKISPAMIELWAQILDRVPGSRLLVKNNSMRANSAREAWTRAFRSHGLDDDRLELVPRVDDYADHLALYGRVDITLDVFPYNGTTTTCESLWMGVPVVTLRGARHVSRVGASLLNRVGLDELVADDPQIYVETAVKLATAPDRLKKHREELRPNMQSSALGDGARFARSLEQAFRTMWLSWLEK